MNDLRQVYDRLPDEAKDAVMTHLYEAMKWRGRATSKALDSFSLVEEVRQIAETFAANGTEIVEYT